MVDTLPVNDSDHFKTVSETVEENHLNDGQCDELWELWSAHGPDKKLVLLPEWFSENEFGARRPFLFTSVEHDDPDSGAVLFSDAVLVDISIVENGVFTQSDEIEVDDAVTVLDISEEDDYIDEPGKVWIPRSLMSVYEQTE